MCEIQSIEFAFLLTLRAWMLSQYLLLNLLHSREPHHTKKKRNVEDVEFDYHTSHISSCHFTSNIMYTIIHIISFHFISFHHIHIHISSCSFALTYAHVPSYAHLWVSSILAKYVAFSVCMFLNSDIRQKPSFLIWNQTSITSFVCKPSPRNHRHPSLWDQQEDLSCNESTSGARKVMQPRTTSPSARRAEVTEPHGTSAGSHQGFEDPWGFRCEISPIFLSCLRLCYTGIQLYRPWAHQNQWKIKVLAT